MSPALVGGFFTTDPPRELPHCSCFHAKIFLLFGAQAVTTVVILFSHSQNTLILMASKQASMLAIMATFPSFFLFFFPLQTAIVYLCSCVHGLGGRASSLMLDSLRLHG